MAGKTAWRLCVGLAAALISALLAAGPRVGAHRARLLLARPGAGLLGDVRVPAAQVPTPRSLASARHRRPGRDARRLPAGFAEARAAVDRRAPRPAGYVLRPTQPRQKISAAEGRSAARPEPRALQALRLRLDPGRREPVRQQRPRRDHARALHGAEIPGSADARPGLRAVQDHERPRRDGRGLLRIPVPLPQRPEPDRGARAASRGPTDRRTRRSRTGTGSPTWGRAFAATCRWRGRAFPRRRHDRRRTAWRPAMARRSARAKDVGIRADRADGFVLRNVKVRHAAEHDIYVLESDGYLLDRFKTFYARRVRRAHVRRGPRPDAELRGGRQRRLGAVSRARAPTRGISATRASIRTSATARRSATATRTTTPAATRAPTATPPTSTTTTSTTTRWDSRRTSSRRRATPASRRTRT